MCNVGQGLVHVLPPVCNVGQGLVHVLPPVCNIHVAQGVPSMLRLNVHVGQLTRFS